MNETYKIRNVGGCLMVTVPRKVSDLLKFKAGDDVKIHIVNTGTGGTMTVEHARKPKGKSR